jgi:hypothetical protein
VGSPLGVEGDHSHEQTFRLTLLLLLLLCREVQRPSPKQTPSVCGVPPFVRECMFCFPFFNIPIVAINCLQFVIQKKHFNFFWK